MTFASDIKKATEKYKEGYNTVVTESLFKVGRSIAFMTPVKEGRAQGNWFASLNTYDGTRKSDATTPQYDQIESIANISVGEIFYLTNNLPYIGKLEFEGHSTQAPQGMVRVSLENFGSMLKDSIANLK